MSETDWANEAAAELMAMSQVGKLNDTTMAVDVGTLRNNIAAALRKERESTVERCAVIAAERGQGHGSIYRYADAIATAIRALNIPKGD